MRKLHASCALGAFVFLAALAGACSGGAGPAPDISQDVESSAAAATDALPATAIPGLTSTPSPTPTSTPEPPTATPFKSTPTPSPYDDTLPKPGSEQFLSTLEPGELLGRAIYEMSFVTSAHVSVETRISVPGSVITTVGDYRLDTDTIYASQNALGIVVELLQRPDGLCTRRPGGEWTAADPRSPLSLGSPRAFLNSVLDGKYENLQLTTGVTTEDGAKAYMLEGDVALDAAGNMALVAEPAADWATVQIMLDWTTAQVLSYRLDAETSVEGAEMDINIQMDFDRHNLPAEFPDGLPASCSALTS